MIARAKFLGFLLCLVWSALSASAAVSWEKNRIDLSAKSTDETATAEFVFKNNSASPVSFTRIQPDCGCVTTSADKSEYAPGETGRVTAHFIVGKQTGERTVPIQVGTTAADSPSAVLVLHVVIVNVVSFSDPFLYWKPEDPLTPKDIVVTLLASESLSLQSVSASNPEFHVELITTGEPSRFRLRVTPPFQRERAFCTISVMTTSPSRPKPHEHTMVARVL